MKTNQIVTPMWKAVCEAQAGESHVEGEKPCQDACAVNIEGDWMFMAVSDGAGSATEGRLGAKIATRVGLRALRRHCPGMDLATWRQSLEDSMCEVHDTVLRSASDRKLSARDLNATCILIAANKHFAVSAQIGDGGAVMKDCKGQLHMLCLPEHGHAANVTEFVTDANFRSLTKYRGVLGPVTGICAFSDGLESVALTRGLSAPFPGFFKPLFDCLAEKDEYAAGHDIFDFLSGADVRERTQDDLSLAISIRTGRKR